VREKFPLNKNENEKLDDFVKSNAELRLKRAQQGAVAIAILLVAIIVFLSFQREEKVDSPDKETADSSQPFSAELAARQSQQSGEFEKLLIDRIRRDGYLTVTVHTALLSSPENANDQFRKADQPSTNLVWGALYGIDTHFPNAAKWKRILTDRGDGNPHFLRRSVFKKTSRPTEHWAARGITEPFDVYVLALAWHGDRSLDAM